jgi:hypothetical protein
MSFKVIIADNFRYQDQDSSYTSGEFNSYELAKAHCRQIVDASLVEAHEAGMTAKELFDSYAHFGEDPHILPRSDGERFSAWDYAKQRCAVICGEGCSTRQRQN